MTRKRMNKLLRAFFTMPVADYNKVTRQSHKRLMRKFANYQIGKNTCTPHAELYEYIIAPIDLEIR